eukprot:CAMPEP_0179405780 /NCGR_PEP_ID=MMETSP0799-20121207/488_1 /TAXON_ID=46947 /ORGANISM="Geminigera cryophila, Strain CCMP2564" /LENGTH=123 /DNA_ID=CAMNT_0021176689 /DNA_START=274 /DNA_END=645 /DNA_ORIENTATION=-
MEVICTPGEDTVPTKDMGMAKMFTTQLEGGRMVNRIELKAGFDWRATVKPKLPGCPDWCPATHFGYLESGQMDIEMQDGTKKTVKAGETYYVPPGHLPTVPMDTVMIEFAQDTTYTSEEFKKA